MYEDDVLFAVMILLTMVAMAVAILIPFCPLDTTYTTESYDIYSVTAPFGIIYADTSGGGGFLLHHSATDLSEDYNIKYYDGNELKTTIARSTSENTHLMFGYNNFSITVVTTRDDLFLFDDFVYESEWYIYIPELPDVNGTTADYVSVGGV